MQDLINTKNLSQYINDPDILSFVKPLPPPDSITVYNNGPLVFRYYGERDLFCKLIFFPTDYTVWTNRGMNYYSYDYPIDLPTIINDIIL